MTGHEHSKTCLVLGATGGIGRVVAKGLVNRGYNVVLHGRNAQKLDTLAEQLRAECKQKLRVDCIQQNFVHRSSIREFIQQIDAADHIHIAILCFGPILFGSIAETKFEEFEFLVDMNLLLPAVIVQTLAEKMKSLNWGRIIAFGGTGSDAVRAYKSIAVYSAAKLGLTSFVRSAALEYSFANININLINLGYVETEYYNTNSLRELKKTKKFLQASQIFDIIEFLISEKADAVSGMVINAGYI